ncbi:hypothetical protein DMP07_03315 [Slackia faecicanis]|uniref:SLH domain-containing protein n=1 Tax=Slackia faecicanis TaxID=255723 RepID=A0A3N0AG32_9ACTN|nr:S8 family serine peptidase [Slackia faecicanis]RNL20625.1 hypothetical protein DMP07_03315 [Slackia faecicanis]
MRIIPTIDATARRNALRGAGAVLVSSSLMFASLGLPAAPAAAAPVETPAAQQAATPVAETAETDGVLVFAAADAGARTLSADDTADAVADGLKELGMQETGRFAAADGTTVIEAAPAAGQSVNDAVAAAEALDGVASAQPNFVYRSIDPVEDAGAASGLIADDAALLAAIAANDPFAQIADPSVPRNQYWLYNANFDDAWNRAQTNGSVAIAVLDTGVMADHADLAANVLTQYGWDAYENAPLYADGQNAFNGGHGTMVAGAAAAVANNGFGMAGASFNASIVPVKVCDDSAKPKIDTKSLLAAYSYVTELARSGKADVRVINLSLGAYGSTLNDRALENAIVAAKDQGIVTVCAGGNGNKAAAPNTKPIYPADFDACVSVTALNADGTNVVWSDYNEYKDISAPGSGITAPLADAGGNTEGFTWASGTSLAAPIVAGAFALMFAAEPDASVDEAKAALYASATPVNDPENDRSQASGSHGALDAAGAVERLVQDHSAFSDVAPSDWFFKPAHYVNERGIMTGYEGAFRPQENLTRAQCARILYNRFGNGAQCAPAPLSDVDQSQWYAPAVNWAVETGMMVGLVGTGRFGVNDELSREQLALVVARAANADTAAADPSAFDALPDRDDTSDWARDAMVWATDEGVINGDRATDPARLLPRNPITRAQMAQVVMNAMERGLI